MKRNLPLSLFLWLAACSSPGAQNASNNTTASKNSTAIPVADTTQPYEEEEDEYVHDITEPPYGLDKVKALIAKLTLVEDPESGDTGSKALDKKTYASLSLNEKFTYHMIHPESYSQNCDILPAQPKKAERIYGTLPDIFGEYDWSERQLNFFKNNRDSVTYLMRSVIEKERTIKGNIKEAIVAMNATELIPYLTEFYNRKKEDHYILTVLLLLMRENQYPEFVNSTGYKKLYGEQTAEDYRNAPHLVYNKANEDLILLRATNFYNGLQTK
jgi:hypothetical protein